MKSRKPDHPTLFLMALMLTLASCGGGSGGSSDDDSAAPSQRTVGKKLYFDEDLSSNANQSCASCHQPAAGFADPKVTAAAPVSEGSVPGRFGARNAPTAAATRWRSRPGTPS